MDGSEVANQGRFGMLVELLGSQEPDEASLATTWLCRLGRVAVLDLILKATERKRSPSHRVAILDVVQTIGGPFDWTEFSLLQSQLGDRNPAIRAKVEEVITSASPAGVPKTPEDWAFARSTNPFLQRLSKSQRRQSPRLIMLGILRNCETISRRLRKRRMA